MDPQTPEWWRDRLIERFRHEQSMRCEMVTYYDATFARVVPYAVQKNISAHQTIIDSSRTPMGQLVVDIVSERLRIQGFRPRAGAPDAVASRAWDEVILANRLDALQAALHRDAGKAGVGYVSVWPMDGGGVRVAIEPTLQVIHEQTPEDPFTTAAAIKVWFDAPAQMWHLRLYLRDSVHKWTAPGGIVSPTEKSNNPDKLRLLPSGNVWKYEGGGRHKMGLCPMVPFIANADSQGNGISDLWKVKPLLHRLELLTVDMLVASSFASFKQKWMTGIEIPIDPDTNEPVETFKVAVDRVWTSPDVDSKFGAIPETDLRPIIAAVSSVVGEIAAVTRIPVSYLVQSELANPPSTESFEGMEVGLVSKVDERKAYFSEGWETVAGLGLTALGGGQVDQRSVTTLWEDSRTRVESQVMDSATKMQAIGVPTEALWSFIGATPDQINAWRDLRRAEDLMNAARDRVAAAQAGASGARPGAGGDDDGDGGQPNASAA